MLYDPSNHRKVVVDRSRLAQQATSQANLLRITAQTPQEEESPVERLTALMDLHHRGLLTEAEYEVQKRKLLGG